MQFSKSIDDDTDIQDTGDEPKRRGCLFYTLLIVLVLPLLLLALAPAILSTSAARNLILAQLNQPLSIRGWYFSWFTPQTISGITYRDEANGITVEVERISISKGLIRLIPIAGLDLGRIEIRRPKNTRCENRRAGRGWQKRPSPRQSPQAQNTRRARAAFSSNIFARTNAARFFGR